MRVAIVSKNGRVSEMDEGNIAEIFNDENRVGSIKLNEYDNHPGLQKMVEILRGDAEVDAIITKMCGPPCVRLAEGKGKKVYFFDGNLTDAIKMVLAGQLAPVSEEDAMKAHGAHRHHH